jgi:pimeloyl-ACP methyl ester carboxylesterase
MFVLDLPSGSPPAGARRLTLLPGNGLCAEFYASLGHALVARGFAVRLITLPGYDGTPPLADPGWPALLEAALPVVREGVRGRGTLVGHSLGGLLALLLAARLGGEVGTLVLMEPAIIPWRWLAGLGAQFYRRRVVDRDSDAFVNRGAGYQRLHDPGSYPAEVFALVRRCRSRSDRTTEQTLVDGAVELHPLPFGEVRARVLLVRGASSGVSQWAGQKALGRLLPDTRAVVIPRAGHWMANEQDGLIADAVDRFVAGEKSTSPP